MNTTSFTLPADARFHDPSFYTSNPYDAYRLLRQHAPVYHYAPEDPDFCPFWIVSTYEHVRTVSRYPQKFTSSKVLSINDLHRSFRANNSSMFRMFTPDNAINLIFSDPPVHTAFRTILNKTFTVAAVKKLENNIRDITGNVFGEITLGNKFDFVQTVAAKIPAAVIAMIVDLPLEDADSIRNWLNSAISCSEEMSEERIKNLENSMNCLWNYLGEKVKERRAHPKDDFITSLTTTLVNGRLLNDEDIIMLLRTVLFGGYETTRNNIVEGLVAFIENPEECVWLRQNPQNVAQAVEEVLRYCNPNVGLLRTATEDVELGSRHIRAGDPVLMLQASANRDESIWTNADKFDVRRSNSPTHLSFGHGAHFCLGSHLARMELRVVFEYILDHIERIKIQQAAKRVSSTLMNPIPELLVVFDDEPGRRLKSKDSINRFGGCIDLAASI